MDEGKKVLENAARLAEKGLTKYTRFLDPAQIIEAEQFARKYGVRFASWGGYEHAERVVGCFYPLEESAEYDAFPIACLHSRYPSKFCSVGHRDILGSFMSLGLTRDCIGDIIIVGSDIYLFTLEQSADYIVCSMKSAGKASLNFSRLNAVPPMPEPEGSAFSAVVSSMRLDAVLAAAYRLSRSEAAELIRAGIVKLDHCVCEQVDTNLNEGALLSLKGKGRVRLVSIDGLTRKQRIGITFFRYE